MKVSGGAGHGWFFPGWWGQGSGLDPGPSPCEFSQLKAESRFEETGKSLVAVREALGDGGLESGLLRSCWRTPFPKGWVER